MTRIRNVVLTSVLIVLASIGCSATVKNWNFPFTIDPNRSRAYYAGDYIMIYLVGEKDILSVRIVLPEKRVRSWKKELTPDGKNAVVHYSGSRLQEFVLPMGPAVPFPENGLYSQIAADTGMVILIDPPVRNVFKKDQIFSICLQGIHFPDDQQFDGGCQMVTMGAFPP
jgi:hypothetical protein